MAVLSNSAGSKDDKDYADAKAVEETLGIKVIRHKSKKPAVRDDILHHF
jgi:phosphatidylglycerophosphatase GEP4